MPHVTTAPRATRPPGQRSSSARGGCRDAVALLDELDRIEADFVTLANSQPTDAERSAFQDMAARVRQAGKDVGRLVRDVTG